MYVQVVLALEEEQSPAVMGTSAQMTRATRTQVAYSPTTPKRAQTVISAR